jgi:hypothetical protein
MMNKVRLIKRKEQIKAGKAVLAHLSIFIHQYNDIPFPKIYVKVALLYEDVRNLVYKRWD